MSQLTVRSVELMKPSAARREVPDSAMPGLYLVIQPSGARSWAVRYRFQGKPRKFTLGAYPKLGLLAARVEAQAALRAVDRGEDPAGEKAATAERAERQEHDAARHRFGHVAKQFVERYAKPRNRTWQEAERSLTRADLAPWQDRDIRQITRRDVLDVLDAMVDRDAATQANRMLAHLRRFFGWAVERDYITTTPISGIKPPTPEVARDRVLTDGELAAVWRAAEREAHPFGPGVRLLILTGARRSEVFGATWREFDLDEATWVVPKERSKNGVEHRIPLVPEVVDLLRSLPRIKGKGLVFTTSGQTAFASYTRATNRLRKEAAKLMPDGVELDAFRLHDLRRTFASGCARLGVPVHVVEKLLNHTSGTFGGIVSVYQRHEYLAERRDALERWTAHVLTVASDDTNARGQG